MSVDSGRLTRLSHSHNMDINKFRRGANHKLNTMPLFPLSHTNQSCRPVAACVMAPLWN
jgi:hypothetical protein